MRRIFLTVKAFAVTAVAVLCVLFIHALTLSPVFAGGERYEFYTGTSSDKIVLAHSPYEKLLLPGVRGESVRYTGNRAEELIARYRATVLFREEAAGVVNYYCFSPLLCGSVTIGEETVNLHIACNGDETAAGTPIIFGGF